MHRLLNTAAAALIASAALPVPAAHAGAWGGIFSQITFTSDNRYQGNSNSDGHAAIYANVHYWRPDGWYAGLSAYQVDFNDPGKTSYELDYYAGKNLKFDKDRTELKLEGMYTAFPDNKTWGPTYDFFQAKVGLKHTEGKLTVNAVTSFVPQASYGSGQAKRIDGEVAYQIAPKLTLNAGVGRRWIAKGQDRTYWNVGVATTWKTLGLDVRYIDTNLSRKQCGPYNPGICGPAVVGTLTVFLPPIL
jgi:uncharacterized protein (TIGR02001 family)